MPTYEYECEGCKHRWEADQGINEAPLIECPDCKEPKAKRQISRSAFILMGGRWASDGYGG